MEMTKLRKLREETRELEDDITTEEMIGLADELTELSKSLRETEADFARVKADTKLSTEVNKARTSRVLNLIERRKFARDVVIEIHHDYEASVLIEIRADTGEEIRRRPLYDHERQIPIEDISKLSNPELGEVSTDGDNDHADGTAEEDGEDEAQGESGNTDPEGDH